MKKASVGNFSQRPVTRKVKKPSGFMGTNAEISQGKKIAMTGVPTNLKQPR